MDQDIQNTISLVEEDEDLIDPIHDIIDYLVRCANISFKNSHVHGSDIKRSEKIKTAYNIFIKSPTEFLTQFGKYLSPNHLPYFENMLNDKSFNDTAFDNCIKHLRIYHSERSTHKRIKNRRFRALQKMQEETDYFSEKQMMFRNPLLYEQLVGQYLDDEEVLQRDSGDTKDLTFLNIILRTVEMNEMNETKHRQMLEEDQESVDEKEAVKKDKKPKKKMWGDFDEPDTQPTPKFKAPRADAPITSNERALLKEEFYQEMYSSFLEGRDEDIDYNSIDNNEQYDDLEQISQDAEDQYFDSEQNDVNNLEEHMKLVEEYGRKMTLDHSSDPLDVFMKHIENKINQ
ncbi:PREDICTED: coiled-coil domain-containing protein 97 [Papilio xuthus]|uniref:Coiled-coil domain-containing protein 97 n=1 Tax=Papilio xuthus TaxID=66420 RepID=A0AAJ7EJ82_PAPXU|nr:PREDICTED: coiled-coil domain-containing protein 97 [Papilio xuthus]